MANSTRLALPFIDAAQSQKHVTHNDALNLLDAQIHLSVLSRNIATPPGTPAEGMRYLLGTGSTGVFAGNDGTIAAFQDGAWRFITPVKGWRTYVENENLFLIFDGAAWFDVGATLKNLQNLTLLGLGAVADSGNPLSAKLNAALFTARTVAESGTGDLRFKLNKETSGNTNSQLYQTGYSGRAETGLLGDDHYHIKVSADGSVWREAFNIDPATGFVGNGTSMPTAALHVDVNDASGVAFLMTGRSAGGTIDHAYGAALVLGYNAAGNRQFVLGDSQSGAGVRILGNALDGFNYKTSIRAALTLGSTTTDVSIATRLLVGTALVLASFTKATVPTPALAGTGALIRVSDTTGGPTVCLSDGTNWKMIPATSNMS